MKRLLCLLLSLVSMFVFATPSFAMSSEENIKRLVFEKRYVTEYANQLGIEVSEVKEIEPNITEYTLKDLDGTLTSIVQESFDNKVKFEVSESTGNKDSFEIFLNGDISINGVSIRNDENLDKISNLGFTNEQENNQILRRGHRHYFTSRCPYGKRNEYGILVDEYYKNISFEKGISKITKFAFLTIVAGAEVLTPLGMIGLSGGVLVYDLLTQNSPMERSMSIKHERWKHNKYPNTWNIYYKHAIRYYSEENGVGPLNVPADVYYEVYQAS